MTSGLIALILFAAFATFVILRAYSPLSSTLQEGVSLRHMAPDLREQIEHVLVIPVAALVVVFIRLTLGPFRPILIAAAFQSVGVFAGLVFMVVVLGVTLLLSPPVKTGLRPYYGRLTAMLCGVTLAAALLSSALVAVDPIRSSMVDYPETLLVIIALIILVSNYLNYRFLAAWNPPVRSEVGNGTCGNQ